MVVQDTLEGSLYILESNHWENGYFGLYSTEDQMFSFVQYHSKDNLSAKRLMMLDSYNVRKEPGVQVSDFCVIYPFSIIKQKQNLMLATESKEERARWIACLTSPQMQTRQCPIDVQSFVDPVLICDRNYEIIGINSAMAKLLKKSTLLQSPLSVIMQSTDLQKFSSLCSSILAGRKSLAPHNCSFYFKSKETCIDLSVRVSLLKGLPNFCFLCQIESLDPLASFCYPDRNTSNPEEKKYGDTSALMEDAFCKFPQENLQANKPKQIGNFSAMARKFSVLQIQRNITLKTHREYNISHGKAKFLSEPALKFKYEKLERTDGYSPRPIKKELAVQSSLHPEDVISWDHLTKRIAVAGGGNSLFFAIELALVGSLVTIVEFQKLRAGHINNSQWNKLDEISVSPAGSAAASLLMDCFPESKICASNELKKVVRFSDVIVVETPFPFDKLFYKQIEEIESAIKPGQLLLLDCYCHTEMLAQVVSQFSMLTPSTSLLCATACEDMPLLDSAFRNKLERSVKEKSITDPSIDEEIAKLAREFLRECNTSRIKNLIAGPINSKLSLEIGKWLLSQSACL